MVDSGSRRTLVDAGVPAGMSGLRIGVPPWWMPASRPAWTGLI